MGASADLLPFLCSCGAELRPSFAGLVQVLTHSIAPGDRPGKENEMLRDKATRKRIELARLLERAAAPERPYIGRGPRYLVHPTITAACASSLRAIAAALRADPLAFDDDALRQVRSFISDGGSPFFGRDETAAMREAVSLQHTVLAPKPAVLDRGQVKPADAHLQHQTPALTRS
jgi:hypothetical protein